MGSAVDAQGDMRSAALAARVWRRVGRRSDGRSPLWIELAIVAWLFWLYDVINNLAPIRHVLALHNARGLLNLEDSLGIDIEGTINRWLAAHGTLSLLASYYYFFAHALITFGVLAWLWWRAPAIYVRLRTALVFINLIAFAVFWRYPLAPPRSFAHLGFIDVIARSGALVSWHSGALVRDADQYAAMPSLHMAWAIWCAVALWQLSRSPLVRVIAIAYPLMTTFIVLGTGNHYVFDVLGGALTVILAFSLQLALWRLFALRRRARATAQTVVEPPPESAARRVPASP